MAQEQGMTGRSERGFAAMDPAKQKLIASMGGRAAHAKGTAHEFTREEAAVAGSKGGKAAHEKGTAHEFSREEAAAAGRKGGQASGARARNRALAAQQTQAPREQQESNISPLQFAPRNEMQPRENM